MTLFIPRIVPLAAAALLAFSSASIAFADEIYATNGVAINGYDAVAYFTDHKPVKGTREFSTSYKGATFYFASAAHRDTFAKDPGHYAPQYGGYCAFGTAEGHKAPTQPQAFTVVHDKLYLNYNDDVAKTWRSDIGGYIRKANANWDAVRGQPAP
ncbi:YHS domain-containing protein (plasmid) [Rhizobium sp. WSM4643]|jgi:YHS domain-containing protein|uniref:YHS domain-containing (seleno)protein n=1 Tax=Rhizobium sp. WSM4643 TaxID=3138253 RepID=UPI0021A32382|nr:YHS domain-containing (seleno)protein [Rhizobium leguminosarum]UWM78865.1 YHS domain-containing protein [Rhizobium leguminosarum bv. viciae]